MTVFDLPPLNATLYGLTEGIVRPIYYLNLITHLILAYTILPLVILTVIPALRSRFDRGRKMGKFTLPVGCMCLSPGFILCCINGFRRLTSRN